MTNAIGSKIHSFAVSGKMVEVADFYCRIFIAPYQP
jgi:hypothetical protein